MIPSQRHCYLNKKKIKEKKGLVLTMKKVTALMLMITVLTLTSVFAVSASAETVETADYTVGDVDKDGSVTVIDSTLIQRFLVDIEIDEKVKTTLPTLGDVDLSGDVNVLDSTSIQKRLISTTMSVNETTASTAAQTTKLDNARLCYDTFKNYGLDNTHIAALLTVFDWASSIDPATVEGTYTKSFDLTTDYITEDYEDYTADVPYSEAYSYISDDGKEIHYCPGIGLLGWTNDKASELKTYAADRGKDWRNLSVQLDAIINGIGLNSNLDEFKHMNINNVEEAVQYAHGALIYGYDWGIKDSRTDDTVFNRIDTWLAQCEAWSADI